MARTRLPHLHSPHAARRIPPLCTMATALSLLLVACTMGAALAEDAGTALELRLADSVKYLSSDELQGRGVGTPGIDVAAEFIATEFSKAGLKTDLIDGGPFQAFSVPTAAELGPEEENQLVLIGPPEEPGGQPRRLALEFGTQFNPLAIGGIGTVEAPLIFVGYGITAKQNDYDDYEGIDVQGKVVFMLRKEPQQDNPHSAFAGTRSSRHALFNTKIANAYEHGAAAVILVNDAFGLELAADTARRQWNETLDELAQKRIQYGQLEDAGEEQAEKHRDEMAKLVDRLGRLKERLSGDFDEILTLHGAGHDSSHRRMPVLFARRELLDQVLKTALGTELAEIEAQIDEDLKPRSGVLKGWSALCQSHVVHKSATVKNVLAVLEGEGPLADETLVIGAHYDHLGMGGPGSMAPWTTEVHNGADDNASGTAVLLELARIFSQRPNKPSRRMMFIAFAGEERGLLGSAHYAKSPLYPLETTVAMVNMDMVGRLDNNKLIVHGTGTASQFDELIQELNKSHQFDINTEPGGFGPSDHATFYGARIPVLHFFTGTHNDYHRPSDDFEKVNLPGMRRITGLVTDVVDRLAAGSRPQYQEIKRQPRARGGDRPYFGSIPDFGRQVEGYALMGVTGDSPAERAGIQAGDVIVNLGDSRIGGLEDFDSALRKYKAGDKVKVIVLRDEERLELSVTLDPPR